MDTLIHPIDIDNLNKGDVISLQEIQKVIGIDPDDDQRAFDLARLALMAKIDTDLQRIGKQFTVAQVKGEIKVLTDEEASVYNSKRLGNAIRTMQKAHIKISSVETGDFDDELKGKHERRVYVSSKFMQSVDNVRKELRLLPHRRNTPTLTE